MMGRGERREEADIGGNETGVNNLKSTDLFHHALPQQQLRPAAETAGTTRQIKRYQGRYNE
jgi:hypothetical protein